jgi:hypothetical protein
MDSRAGAHVERVRIRISYVNCLGSGAAMEPRMNQEATAAGTRRLSSARMTSRARP